MEAGDEVWTVDPDERFMRVALSEARRALEEEEVPVGAVAVFEGEVIGRAHNQMERLCDPTAHAEMIVLTQAATALRSPRLTGVDVYVTLEPCTMCIGALMHARVRRVFFGASDPKTGACGSVVDLVRHPAQPHRLEVKGGLLGEGSADLLRDFFQGRR